MVKRHGVSFLKRVEDINRIYDEQIKRGLTNREIWRRYIYPVFGLSERQFYNVLKAPSVAKNHIADDCRQLLLFDWDEVFKKDLEHGKQ